MEASPSENENVRSLPTAEPAAGYRVPPNYDSLVSKMIVHGSTRNECLMRLRRALEECVISGIETTIPLLERIVVAPDFVNGTYDIRWLEQFVEGTR